MPTPIPDDYLTFPETLQRLLVSTEDTLFFLAKLNMTREQAEIIKRRFSLPIGSLSARHGLTASSRAKAFGRTAFHAKTVDKSLNQE